MSEVKKTTRTRKKRSRSASTAKKSSAAMGNNVVETKKSSINPAKLLIVKTSFVICIFSIGFLMFLALVSYHANDPSLNSAGFVGETKNWIGPFGSYLADVLYQSVGISALLIPVAILWFSLSVLNPKRFSFPLRRSFGFILAIVAVSNIVQLFDSKENTLGYHLGGALGLSVSQWSIGFIATPGTAIIMLGILSIAAALIFEHRLVVVFSMLDRCARFVFAFLKRSFVLVFSKLKVYGQELFAHQHSVAIAGADDTGKVAVDLNGRITFEELSTHDNFIEPSKRMALENAKAPSIQETSPHNKNFDSENNDEFADALAHGRVEPAFELGDDVDLIEEQGFELGDFDYSPTPIVKEAMRRAAYEDALNDKNNADDLDEEENSENETERALEEDSAIESPQHGENFSKHISVIAKEHTPEPIPEIVEYERGIDKKELEQVSKVYEKEIKQVKKKEQYELPHLSYLDFDDPTKVEVDHELLQENSDRLIETLKSFGIKGHVREIRLGPVVTMFEFVPAPGTKLSKISALADDIAMSMAALRVRIVAPIPGKGAVGIEIPNEQRQIVYLKEVIASHEFRKSKSPLTLCLGKDIEGTSYVADLQKMPHLLIAGATGTGKSVAINAMLTSILYKAKPEDVRMIMVDPKQLELSIYEGIPHLMLPVVTDPRKAALALQWAVNEMERRYTTLAHMGVRDIKGYNKKLGTIPQQDRVDTEGNELEHMPHIVILIDEFADLMMVASREVETFVARLAQKARAAGIHLILATQRPSVDVITGVIKANFPTRISFQVASKHDSRTILDTVGSEHLLGKGDMLYMPPATYGLIRIHGAFVSEQEIARVVDHLKEQGQPSYDESILAVSENTGISSDEPIDEMYDQAVAFVAEKRKVSISVLQRYLRIGYNRSARIVEHMEQEGIIGPADGSKPREVLIPPPPEL